MAKGWMKIRLLFAAAMIWGAIPVFGGGPGENMPAAYPDNGDIVDTVGGRLLIRPIEITGARSMKKIGLQETGIPERVLHDNIASQMSDALKFGTSVYVKEYGRATLSTVAFRGTSASHTQVAWNGMKISSPMLGMVDFSMIPSYFIDGASLLHGTSSVNLTGGGLGGAVVLSTKPADTRGFGLQYIQGMGMYKTFDEFLRLNYGSDRWQVSTRAFYSSSRNDFKYRNNKTKLNVYDDDYNIIDSYHPIERNESGYFNDFHIMQEAYHNTRKGNRVGLSAWYLDSRRGVPMLKVDQREDSEYVNEQRERTFRGVVSWDMARTGYRIGARAGYINTAMKYDYSRDLGNGSWVDMIRSRSYVNTVYGAADGEYYVGRNWLFTANVSMLQHFVRSTDRSVAKDGDTETVGYDQARVELSGVVSAKWMPVQRLGLSLVLREEMFGGEWSPVIPAFFAEYVLSRRGNVRVKGSVSRNFRFPTLNDLYFKPGGNPGLKKERGFSYDCGAEFTMDGGERYMIHGEAMWFDSRIRDWIAWLPSFNGLSTPVNIREVHAYGVELKGALDVCLAKDWSLSLNGSFSWTPSINHGDPVSWADEAIGKQMVYIPEFSSALVGRLAFRTWSFDYKWCYYSERFTTTSNTMATTIGLVTPYYMSDISLAKQFCFRWADLSVRCAVKNLFDEEYESVLSHPMPGINFEIFLGITPKWGKKK